ncbi:MAG: type IV pilus assembly protein PilM [Cellulomonas sp.]|nr:type IV pilus assembly protein PilM [Cellulomonas sp.]
MSKSRVIGLDIGATAVRAAQVEFGAGGPTKGPATLSKYGEVALPVGAVRDGEVAERDYVVSALRELWIQQKFDTRDVVIGVGNQRVVVRELSLPWMPLNQLKATLPFHVQELLPMSVDEALLDFYPTSTSDSERGREVHGMLVAAVRDTVTANVLTVESAGLRPIMVDLNAFALLRGMTRGSLAQRTVALVDIGARVTNVVIAAGGVPRFIRTLALGGQDGTDAIARATNTSTTDAESLKRQIGIGYAVPPEYVDAAEALKSVTQNLVEAVRNTFVYYSGNNPGAGLELAVLTGGGAHLPGLGQYLSSASRLAVSLGDPVESMQIGRGIGGREALAGRESLMAMSIGLAYGVAA